jgi:antitoxin component YwqK of YwqJK toxin-antitoxin module
MRIKVVLSILSFLLRLASTSAQQKDTLCFKRDTLNTKLSYCSYPSGQIHYINTIVGEFESRISFHPNGKISGYGTTINGYVTGYNLSFYDNGHIQSEGYYRKVGSGMKLKSKDTYYIIDFDGYTDSGDSTFPLNLCVTYYVPKEGIWKDYYPSGKIKQISIFKIHDNDNEDHEEIREGIWEFYDNNGKLVRKVTYAKNKIINIERF